jgi:hypothetical protein
MGPWHVKSSRVAGRGGTKLAKAEATPQDSARDKLPHWENVGVQSKGVARQRLVERLTIDRSSHEAASGVKLASNTS